MNDIIIMLNEQNITQIDGFISNGFRWLGWALIKILATIVNGMETVVTNIYNLNGFFYSPEVNELINTYKPLIWVILSISIAMLGIKIIYNRKQDRGQLPANLIFSVVIIMLLPTLMIKLNDITSLAVKSTTSEYTSSANELVKNSIYDMHYLDSINYKLDGAKNKIPSDKIFRIDENELVDKSEFKNKDVVEKKVKLNKNGEIKVEKLEKGWLKIDEEYYRYSMDFISIIISLGAMAVTLLCVALKVARLLFELAFDKLFAILFAFADIDDGKKLKEIIKHIATTFIIIFATAMMTKLYVIFTAWLGSNLGNAGLDTTGLAKIVVLIGVSIAVVNGPALIERILGMDAGLKSGWAASMAGYGLTKGAGKVASAGVAAGISAGKMVLVGGAGAVGAMKGGLGKNDEINKEENEAKENEKSKDGFGKPLSEEMKNSNGAENMTNKETDSEESKDNMNEVDVNTTKANAIDNEAEDLKSNDKSVNTPTLQDEMNNTNGENSSSNNESADSDKASDVKDNLDKEKLKNNNSNKTLEQEIKQKSKDNNMNKNPLQEEMKNSINGDKDKNNFVNIAGDLEKDKPQNINKSPEDTVNQKMKEEALGNNKNINPNKLQEEMKSNGSINKDINKNIPINMTNDLSKEKQQNSINPNNNNNKIEPGKGNSIQDNKQNPLQQQMNSKQRPLNTESTDTKDNINDINSNIGNKNIPINMANDLSKEKQQNSINPNNKIELGKDNSIQDNKQNPLQQEMNSKQRPLNTGNTDAKDNINDINSNIGNKNRESNSSSGINGNNAKINSAGENIKTSSEVNNDGVGTRKNTTANMEDRDIRGFVRDGFKNSKLINDMSRSYNLGKNTTSKWNVKKENGKEGNK